MLKCQQLAWHFNIYEQENISCPAGLSMLFFKKNSGPGQYQDGKCFSLFNAGLLILADC